MYLLIDLRGCHYHQDRGIPSYAQSLALQVARSGAAICSFLVHKDRPSLSEEGALREYGEVLYHEDVSRVGIRRCDAFLITSLMHGLDTVDELERLAVPLEVMAHRPMVCAVLYDLIPLIFKEVYLQHPATSRGYFAALNTLKLCDHIFSISEASASDAVRIAGISPAKITTIWGGIDSSRWVVSHESHLSTRSTEVVYVGGEDFRKNMAGLVRGFGLYKKNNPYSELSLAVVCSQSRAGKKVMSELLKSEDLKEGVDVKLTGYLAHDELVKRVASARSSIFPSLYEGLGLPILESYAAGTPVFGSDKSAVAEMVHPACRFNPYSVGSIAAAFENIEHREELFEASLEFGRDILGKFSWGRSSKIVTATISGQLASRRPSGHRADVPMIGLFGPSSPEQTGVGIYNSTAFSGSKKRIVLFTDFTGERSIQQKTTAIKTLSRKPDLLLAPVAEFSRFQPPGNYLAHVFAIGNSHHSLSALKAAIGNRVIGVPRVLYLHEARVTGLLLAYFGGDANMLASRLTEYYPELGAWCCHRATLLDILSCHVMGVRLLIALTGACTIFVNSRRAKTLIEAELSSFSECKFEVLFHPVFPPGDATPERRAPHDEIVIGHFGIVGPMKRPELLIAASRIISHDRKVRLLFAGYSASAAIHSLDAPEFVECIDAPTDARMISLMRGVDIAVQPREPDHGESSGVINQLISVGKRPITSSGTAADDLGELVLTVPRGATAKTWSDAILKVHESDRTSISTKHLSVEAFGRAFDAAIDRLKVD
ncbi:glycosyl transferase, group 1 [Nitrobacter hamburgensis X14]|uniref:Glycosyl transferase, group 1 n=2 Tax=Nitrobacter hamburgensis TaxID=912 RepID=Q1QKT6_NITHX|nr:glycosyl transferase, group 1 [Nitrobacter hamburgensis X14]